jgi:hypothetical protein
MIWRIRSGDDVVSPVTFQVFDSGLKWTSKRGSAAYQWHDVIRLRRSSTLIEIWTSRMAARLTPTAAIGDKAAVMAFYERCQNLWRSAKSNKA